ncbi:MAG: helix-turn-helix domain-containing protein [Oscillibacter sp.]|jgi:excisionase family DNA binding protein|nr:helix-turn-helix domain-containing protein [Oscillibacter sp.]MEA4993290.1 helix-turn-helix domain-containing protein [Oscillibacter sp.]
MNAMNEQTRAAVEEVRRTNCEFLTIPQVAKILKVNKNTVYDLIGVKLLRAVKLGSTKVSTIAVEDFIAQMDSGEIEYDTKTKKSTRHKKKVSEAVQSKIK